MRASIKRAVFVITSGVVAALLITTTATAAPAPTRPVTHDVSSCGKQTKVYTPARPDGTLSAHDLGLPARADRPGTLLYQAKQAHARWLPTVTCKPRPDRRHHRRPPLLTRTSADLSSGNWSGYQVNTSGPNYAQAFWTVPGVQIPAPPDAFSAVWPGIGGGFDGSAELVQDGTEQDATCIYSRGVCEAQLYPMFFWFEIYPDEVEQQITSLVPNPGDSVATDVYWDSSQGASFTLCDFTQQACVTYSQQPAAPPDGTAEWIVERPTINGNLLPLADFSTVNITSAFFGETPQGDAEYPISAGNFSSIDMYGNGTQLDATSPLGADGASFSVTWYNSGG
jgi:Peptidase A4 family